MCSVLWTEKNSYSVRRLGGEDGRLGPFSGDQAVDSIWWYPYKSEVPSGKVQPVLSWPQTRARMLERFSFPVHADSFYYTPFFPLLPNNLVLTSTGVQSSYQGLVCITTASIGEDSQHLDLKQSPSFNCLAQG